MNQNAGIRQRGSSTILMRFSAAKGQKMRGGLITAEKWSTQASSGQLLLPDSVVLEMNTFINRILIRALSITDSVFHPVTLETFWCKKAGRELHNRLHRWRSSGWMRFLLPGISRFLSALPLAQSEPAAVIIIITVSSVTAGLRKVAPRSAVKTFQQLICHSNTLNVTRFCGLIDFYANE